MSMASAPCVTERSSAVSAGDVNRSALSLTTSSGGTRRRENRKPGWGARSELTRQSISSTRSSRQKVSCAAAAPVTMASGSQARRAASRPGTEAAISGRA
jgi:hypothetical protein